MQSAGEQLWQSALLELAGALVLLQWIKLVPVYCRVDLQMGLERRPGLLVEGKGSPAIAAGCLRPRWEAWAVGPLLTSQANCLSQEHSSEQLPSRTNKGPKAGPSLPSAVWLLQSRVWKEASLRVQFGAIYVHCARP